jgi:hypothetical protein
MFKQYLFILLFQVSVNSLCPLVSSMVRGFSHWDKTVEVQSVSGGHGLGIWPLTVPNCRAQRDMNMNMLVVINNPCIS